jgi:hypothetical protein
MSRLHVWAIGTGSASPALEGVSAAAIESDGALGKIERRNEVCLRPAAYVNHSGGVMFITGSRRQEL